MKRDNEEKSRQVRKTLEDTQSNQKELKDLLKLLINENRAMRLNEREQLPGIMAKAMLSQGATECITLIIQSGWFTFASLQSLILRVSEINEPYIRLETHRPTSNVQKGSIAEIWKYIYEQLQYYFPLASAEAVRLSKESSFMVEQEAYDFDSTQEV